VLGPGPYMGSARTEWLMFGYLGTEVVWSAEERTVVIGGEGFDRCVGGRWLSRAADSEDQTEVGVAGVPEELVPETGGLSDGTIARTV